LQKPVVLTRSRARWPQHSSSPEICWIEAAAGMIGLATAVGDRLDLQAQAIGQGEVASTGNTASTAVRRLS
jgi:hypothetical protein